MPSHVDSALDARLQRLDQEFQDAIALLKTRPGWLQAKVTQHERVDSIAQAKSDEEVIYGSAARLQFILRLFDGRAEPYSHLVEDTPTQEAYFAMLECFARIAWHELTGGHPLGPPADPAACDQKNAINLRSHSWATKAYRRLLDRQEQIRGEHVPYTASESEQDRVTVLNNQGREVGDQSIDRSPTRAELAQRRRAVVIPLLNELGLNPSSWTNKTTLTPAVAYAYLSGRSNPRPGTRKELADAIGIPPDRLPD